MVDVYNREGRRKTCKLATTGLILSIRSDAVRTRARTTLQTPTQRARTRVGHAKTFPFTDNDKELLLVPRSDRELLFFIDKGCVKCEVFCATIWIITERLYIGGIRAILMARQVGDRRNLKEQLKELYQKVMIVTMSSRRNRLKNSEYDKIYFVIACIDIIIAEHHAYLSNQYTYQL